ncbi:AAA family ATPase [Paenibacillus marinisediminis]
MKKLIMINGTMGIGKTTTCNELLKITPNSVFLDGDWCWNMNPFIVTEETKEMVVDNITHIIRNYLSCSVFQTVIFCWVMHQSRIIDEILNALSDCEYELHLFTLVSSQQALETRLMRDIEADIRTIDVLERSLSRLSLYDDMDTVKIDVTHMNANQAAQQIVKCIEGDIN